MILISNQRNTSNLHHRSGRMREVGLRYGEHGIGVAIMIVVRVAEARNCGMLFGRCLGIPYRTRTQRYLQNTVPRIALNVSHAPDGKGLMRIISLALAHDRPTARLRHLPYRTRIVHSPGENPVCMYCIHEVPCAAPNDITWTVRGSERSELYSANGIIFCGACGCITVWTILPGNTGLWKYRQTQASTPCYVVLSSWYQ